MTKTPTLMELLNEAIEKCIYLSHTSEDANDYILPVLVKCRTALESKPPCLPELERRGMTGGLEDEYENALVAAEMFDAPIVERTLTALHDEVARITIQNEELRQRYLPKCSRCGGEEWKCEMCDNQMIGDESQ